MKRTPEARPWRTPRARPRRYTKAVADALGYLESRALRVRRGAGGAELLCAEGFVAAAFVHRTSRAGDPQLHTHVLVAYGEDGRWSATWPRLLYHHARTAGFLYQAALRARLTDALGVRFGPLRHGRCDVRVAEPVEEGDRLGRREREVEPSHAPCGIDAPGEEHLAVWGHAGEHHREGAGVDGAAEPEARCAPTDPHPGRLARAGVVLLPAPGDARQVVALGAGHEPADREHPQPPSATRR